MRTLNSVFVSCVYSISIFSCAWAFAAPPDVMSSTLTPVKSGASALAGGYYVPQRLMLTSTKPDAVKQEPKYDGKPMYGLLSFGSAKQNTIPVALDAFEDGKTAKLYVDADRTGDLSKPPVVLIRHGSKAKSANGEEYEDVFFQASIPIAPVTDIGDKQTPLSIFFYNFSPETTKQRGMPAGMLLYYRDYGLTGKVMLAGKSYPILILDEYASGKYENLKHGEREFPHISLLIDRDGDGKFNPKFERYDASAPFNIGGVTYELDKIASDGSSLSLKKSTQKVAEIPIPANIGVGHSTFAFTQHIIGGNTVNFPSDYRGKVVMLDFWATWCGPCIGEIPGLVKTYMKYHSKGFEVLGVSLDQANQEEKVKRFLKEKSMTWDQVYDGKYWSAEVAKMYGVDSIPHAILVDGTTGRVIADGDALRGESLDATVSKALENHKTSPLK